MIVPRLRLLALVLLAGCASQPAVFRIEPVRPVAELRAEALVRASQALHKAGYGILVHDAYRPWYVTKIFWDATPAKDHIYVADPAEGSRHNRGCAADITLYSMRTGKVMEMPGVVDEMSERSNPVYPGGTSLQRWRRDLLRHAVEREGFRVYEAEWWHFDYPGWKEFPILNARFEDLH